MGPAQSRTLSPNKRFLLGVIFGHISLSQQQTNSAAFQSETGSALRPWGMSQPCRKGFFHSSTCSPGLWEWTTVPSLRLWFLSSDFCRFSHIHLGHICQVYNQRIFFNIVLQVFLLFFVFYFGTNINVIVFEISHLLQIYKEAIDLLC